MSDAELAAGVKAALAAALEGQRDAVRAAAEPLSEADFWRKPVEPGNSVGHLVLHLAGNLNHFVGAQLGGTGYVRDREREFTEANPPPVRANRGLPPTSGNAGSDRSPGSMADCVGSGLRHACCLLIAANVGHKLVPRRRIRL